MFNEHQQCELKRMAESILESRSWDELPWQDAWLGSYPEKPTDQDVVAEYRVLCEKAARIINGADLEAEYGTLQEHVRMIYLETAKSFQLR
ncbi:MAG: hypothetical protein V7739_22085 [Motiliproteus sp.]